MSERIERADAFFVEVLRYLDGEMSADEARRFERRVESDPELRERYDEIADLDTLERVTRAWAPPERGRRPRRYLGWSLLVAATALGVIAVRALLSGPERADSRQMHAAALPVDASLESYNERLGLPGEWLPEGYALLGAPGETPAPSVEEYVERVRELERSRVDAALSGEPPAPVEVARFVVPFRSERDVHAVCVLLPDDQAPELLEPPRGRPTRRFEGGRAHVLPRPTVAAPETEGSQDRELFDWGYRLSPTTRTAAVVLGLREERPDAALLAELRARLTALDPTGSTAERERTLRAWLERSGFTVRVVPLTGGV